MLLVIIQTNEEFVRKRSRVECLVVIRKVIFVRIVRAIAFLRAILRLRMMLRPRMMLRFRRFVQDIDLILYGRIER